MKMRMKLSRLFFAIMMFLGIGIIFRADSYAADSMKLVVSQTAAAPGDEVSININITDNPGIASLKFEVKYDSIISLKNVTFNPAFGSYATAPEPLGSPQTISFISPLNDVNTNGVFATLVFDVSAEASNGAVANIKISVDQDNTFNSDFDDVAVSVTNGKINISTGECIHSNTEVIREVPATCLEGGYTAGEKCADCGKILVEPVYVNALGHDWDEGEIKIQPSVMEEGLRIYHCKRCEATKEEKVEKLRNDYNFVLAVSSLSGRCGGEVVIPVSITKNDGISGFSFTTEYDTELLSLKEIRKGEAITEGSFAVNKNIVNWYNAENTDMTGIVFYLVFDINADAKSGDTSISIKLTDDKKANLSNVDDTEIKSLFVDSTLSIFRGVKGDVTGDEDVAINDVVKLNRAVLHLITLTDDEKLLGDVTGDNEIAINDVVKLNRYVLKIVPALSSLRGSDPTPNELTDIYVSDICTESGKTVDVPVMIKNNAGIAGLAINFVLPDNIHLNEVKKGTLLEEGTFTASDDSISWYNTTNISGDGVLCYLNVTVANIPSFGGTISVELKDGLEANISDENGESISVAFKSGSIDKHDFESIVEKQPTYDSEGKVIYRCKRCNYEYSDTIKKLKKESIELAKVVVAESNIVYNGKQQRPSVKVELNGAVLKSSVDYDASYSNNINAGKASVIVTGKGKYSGSVTTYFNIKPISNSVKVSKKKVSLYAASKVQTFNMGAKAKYGDLSYSTNDKKVKVDKKGKVSIPKNYSGVVTVTATAKKKNYETVSASTVFTVSPAEIKGVKLTRLGGKKLKISWNKCIGSASYEIEYATQKSFKNAKTVVIKKGSTTSTTIKKLSKKKYYVRMRAFDSKKKVSTKWTKTMSVLIK